MEEVEGERLSAATLDRHSVLSTSFHPPEDRVPRGSTISEKIEKFFHVLTLHSTVQFARSAWLIALVSTGSVVVPDLK
jgi:hypothetical protein